MVFKVWTVTITVTKQWVAASGMATAAASGMATAVNGISAPSFFVVTGHRGGSRKKIEGDFCAGLKTLGF